MKKRIFWSLTALLFFMTTGIAGAAIISVSPLSSIQTEGDIFTVNIIGEDFTGGSGGSGGGSLNISWNPAVISLGDLADVELLFPGDLLLQNKILDTAAGTLFLDVSSLFGTHDTSFDIASLTFSALNMGTSGINLEIPPGIVWPDYDLMVDLDPTLLNGSVQVNPVPIPGSLLLLGPGLIGLVGLGRKKRN